MTANKIQKKHPQNQKMKDCIGDICQIFWNGIEIKLLAIRKEKTMRIFISLEKVLLHYSWFIYLSFRGHFFAKLSWLRVASNSILAILFEINININLTLFFALPKPKKLGWQSLTRCFMNLEVQKMCKIAGWRHGWLNLMSGRDL